MNLLQPPRKGGLRGFLRVISLLLLQHALAPGVIDAHARSRLPASSRDEGPPSRPYLKIAAVVPLRFNSPPPPPDLTVKPAAGAPPQPVENTPPETAAAATVASAAVSETTPAAATAANPAGPATIAATATTTPAATEPVAPPPVSILPDDTRPATRAEDFLPFFQFPTSGGDVTVAVPASVPRAPAPGQLPPSSATYQQR